MSIIGTPDYLRGKRVRLTKRKEDETAFVNARTYWELTITPDREGDRTYFLRIKHHHPEEYLAFGVWHEETGETRLLTEDEYHEHEVMWEDYGVDIPDAVVCADRMEAAIRAYLLHHWHAVCLLVDPSIDL